MPIRFRCFYCNQLMAISHRKAGAMVRCPTCASQVMVPQGSSESAKKETAAVKPSIFDRNDFEKVLEGVPPAPPPPPPVVPLVHEPVPAPISAMKDAGAAQAMSAASPRRRGYFLSPTLATVLCVA